MFEFIDGNGSGTIDLQEFYYGVSFLALQTSSVQAIPTETIQTLQLLRSQTAMLREIENVSKRHAAILTSMQRSAEASTKWAL